MLDLFSGACGGWSLGMERAGFRTLAACEIDPWRRRVYGANFPHARLYDDVGALTATRLLADLGGRAPDVVCASPPCQDVSAANVRGRGLDGDRSGTGFDHALRLAAELRPRWLALENSPRLRTRGADRVLAGLEQIGYTPTPVVVGAWHAGLLHRRQRCWILAVTDTPRAGTAGWGSPGRWLEFAQTHAGAGHPADADEVGGPGRRRRAECGEEAGRQPAEPVRLPTHEERRRGRNGSDQLFPHDPPWVHAGEKLGRSLRGFDGVSDWLARACCSAFGDAVVPQISYAIGRAILKTEADLAAADERRIAA
ncbi:DNA cytosine methyltransferase [Methylobacterium hispanicum]|uniref:DNA cytosine methyltransferase n=1 Tax=Methylobacterium hispanicum TaxID=270350 RepID=UPI001EDCDAE0|nr:DNA cytosine methyltransferase [Methylobacterium hispanicum]